MIKRSKRIIDKDLNIIGRLNKRKNEYGEYVIKGYEDGKRCEDADYFTDDWDDALNTAKAVAKQRFGELKQAGYQSWVIYGISLDETRNRRYSTKDSKKIKDSANNNLYVFEGVNYEDPEAISTFGISNEEFMIVAENENEAEEKLLNHLGKDGGDKSWLSYSQITEYNPSEVLTKFNIIL